MIGIDKMIGIDGGWRLIFLDPIRIGREHFYCNGFNSTNYVFVQQFTYKEQNISLIA